MGHYRNHQLTLKSIIIKQTGIELIAQERKEQIEKHGISVDEDVKTNEAGELKSAAFSLIGVTDSEALPKYNPWPWDKERWGKICAKPYKERLVVAGALIAAEIDRLQATE